jgi:hypothetical protein
MIKALSLYKPYSIKNKKTVASIFRVEEVTSILEMKSAGSS